MLLVAAVELLVAEVEMLDDAEDATCREIESLMLAWPGDDELRGGGDHSIA